MNEYDRTTCPNPMAEAKALIERNRTAPADEIAGAMIDKARQRFFDTDDPGVMACRAQEFKLTYGCPENPIFFDPGDGREWEQARLARRADRYDRDRDFTRHWWLPFALLAIAGGAWLVLKALGLK